MNLVFHELRYYSASHDGVVRRLATVDPMGREHTVFVAGEGRWSRREREAGFRALEASVRSHAAGGELPRAAVDSELLAMDREEALTAPRARVESSGPAPRHPLPGSFIGAGG